MPSIVIIGAGFSSVCTAIKLLEAGIDTFSIFEKSDLVGGVWCANMYPGAACDIQSHLYSYSFAPTHDWTRKYATQHEIRAYVEHCAERYGVLPRIRFKTAVLTATFVRARDRSQGENPASVPAFGAVGVAEARSCLHGAGALARSLSPLRPDPTIVDRQLGKGAERSHSHRSVEGAVSVYGADLRAGRGLQPSRGDADDAVGAGVLEEDDDRERVSPPVLLDLDGV